MLGHSQAKIAHLTPQNFFATNVNLMIFLYLLWLTIMESLVILEADSERYTCVLSHAVKLEKNLWRES